MIDLKSAEAERERIDVLKRYNILDTPADGTFDKITQLASTIFKVPIAIISLVDTDRIWFKSHYGLPINQIHRSPGLCSSAILSPDPYIVENAIEDPRTLANPLVAGEFGLRFYAAAALQTEDHYNLGTLCIIDKSPRTFTQAEFEILQQLASIVMNDMEIRLSVRKTVAKIKHLAQDISTNLKRTTQDMSSLPAAKRNGELLSYLDNSRIVFSNIENELQHL
ncbi:GAF domain-containing protein [Segetibacter aerophilus]|uniref:GAF domain-containing protein n=1 Tax=Segetibacter aerophilus TaxID=670293 RepID=A0A512B6D8_9BACT|nr:GAF domain-containing protein [Segetibacter aerophilus]GEO07515.1 hypothetical protein SAE01_00110 [Segetibacter aerophilus]